MHKRTEIRNELASILTGTTVAQTRVYKNRPQNIQSGATPAINIQDGGESQILRDLRSTAYIRTFSVKITIKIEATSDYDVALDALANEIEAIIDANRTLNGKASGITLTGTDEPEFDPSGQKPVGTTTLNYEIKYLS